MNQPVNSADIHKAIVQEQASQDRKKLILNGVLLLILLAAPFMIYPVFLMKILCFALFAVAFNLLFGFTGLLSFGHAAFLATGGYTTGYLLSNYSGLIGGYGAGYGLCLAVDSPAGHLFRDGDPGAGATCILLLRPV